jgi:hypothetical protein
MALFANITAADLKKGDIIMFAMGSSSPGRVAPRADRCLGGQFACAPMYYGVFSAIVDVKKWWLWVLIWRRERVEKRFYVGINFRLL